MTVHLDVETLSTYLDQELSGSERSRVEDHLEACDDCQQRLFSLQRIVGDLQSVERMSPPAQMGVHLHRLAALQASEPSLTQRLEQRVSRFAYPSSILPIFAVVVALIVIIYMFSLGLHRQATGRIPVHLEPDEIHLERGDSLEMHDVAGRLFYLVDDLWLEQGLEGATEVEVIPGGDPRVEALLSEEPRLQGIVDLGSRVRLQTAQGEVVEIHFDAD